MTSTGCCFTGTNTTIYCFAPFTYCTSSIECPGATRWSDVCVIYPWCYALMGVAALLLFVGLAVSICIACRCRRADVTYIYASGNTDAEPLIDSSGRKSWGYQESGEPVSSHANRNSANISEPATDTSQQRPAPTARPASTSSQQPPQQQPQQAQQQQQQQQQQPTIFVPGPYGAVNTSGMFGQQAVGIPYMPGPYANAPYILYAAAPPNDYDGSETGSVTSATTGTTTATGTTNATTGRTAASASPAPGPAGPSSGNKPPSRASSSGSRKAKGSKART